MWKWSNNNMSTDRVEIIPDTDEKSLEQSAEELKKNDGVDVSRDNVINADGTSIKIKDIKQEDLQTSTEDRPLWLPEKFKNAEDLAKAYSQLEKQFSSRTQQEEEKSETKIPEADGKRVQSLDKFYNEFAENGSLAETSYIELAKQGLTKELVDGYIEGQKSLSDNAINTVHEVAGGKEKYAELIDWASKNLSDGEQTAFNNMVDAGNTDQSKFAVQGLMSRAGMTNNPTQPELFQGTSDITPTDSYQSVSQVTDAMNDPRYEKDPSYRKQVTDKLGRSTVI
jgi:hypothetical protein